MVSWLLSWGAPVGYWRISVGRAPLWGFSSWGRREGCPWEARSWRDVDGGGPPPPATLLGLLRGAHAAHALRYSLPRDTLPSGPLSPIAWRYARFVGCFF